MESEIPLRGSLPEPGTLLGVKTWLSTLEIVYLCVFRRRHIKAVGLFLVSMPGEVKDPTSQGWIPRRVVSAYDVVNASYLPTTINIYDLEIRSINNYCKSYDIASFLVSTTISRRCRFGHSKPCKYIRSSYVRRNCIYDNNRVSANISSYDYR